jgi:hypothetical protein
MGAVLASMRASEQIDAFESLSIDSFKVHCLWTSQAFRVAPFQARASRVDRFLDVALGNPNRGPISVGPNPLVRTYQQMMAP